MNPELPKKHRRLSRFLCGELLFEYGEGRLDASRRADVEAFLADDWNLQADLENLRKGARYAESLATLDLNEEFSRGLRNFEPRWRAQLYALTQNLPRHRWRALPILATLTALALVTYTYRHFDVGPDQILAERSPAAAAPADEILLAPSSAAPTVGQTASVSTGLTATSTTAAAGAKSGEKAVQTAAKGKAELWRGTLKVSDFSRNSNAIRSKMRELGGRAAGSVELGWLRHDGEAYFHLALPEENFAQFQEYLSTLGPVRIAREPHARRMPTGQIRIILVVKDNGPHDPQSGSPAESP